jgi:2-keto-4-pentenoate hydratase/2-oxohepta-3-ene-1,7-dioic acid hydratase in catechol pathway
VGRIFRPGGEPLTPNWKHMPIGYDGRAGTAVVSGTDVVRPSGQRKRPAETAPTFGPGRALDFEAELGFVVGGPTQLGQRVSVDDAEDHIFGVVLLNDWSARDIQAWEYVPLGPFLGKSGTISGPDEGTFGSLLELTFNGAAPLTLEDGTTRSFLADADTVSVHAWATGSLGHRIELGEVVGTVRPAI